MTVIRNASARRKMGSSRRQPQGRPYEVLHVEINEEGRQRLRDATALNASARTRHSPARMWWLMAGRIG